MKTTYMIGTGIAMILLSGCATTTDPRQGGLFSYNPSAYEQRLSDKEQNLAGIESDTSKEKHKTKQLNRTLSTEKKKLKEYQ